MELKNKEITQILYNLFKKMPTKGKLVTEVYKSQQNFSHVGTRNLLSHPGD